MRTRIRKKSNTHDIIQAVQGLVLLNMSFLVKNEEILAKNQCHVMFNSDTDFLFGCIYIYITVRIPSPYIRLLIEPTPLMNLFKHIIERRAKKIGVIKQRGEGVRYTS